MRWQATRKECLQQGGEARQIDVAIALDEYILTKGGGREAYAIAHVDGNGGQCLIVALHKGLEL